MSSNWGLIKAVVEAGIVHKERGIDIKRLEILDISPAATVLAADPLAAAIVASSIVLHY